MSQPVTLVNHGRVAVITIDNPPVNALSQGVPEGLEASIASAKADPAIQSIVIIGGGRTFVAGADINEFAKSIAAGKGAGPDFTPLLQNIENSPKPVVVAIHGAALGGGLELAMAAHYRIALPDAQVGLPEANLGIVPGAGGTQRLPRLVGFAKAAEMLVSGQIIKAPAALEIGLIDKIVEDDLLPAAIEFAQQVASIPHTKTRDKTDKLGTTESNAAGFAAARDLARKTRRNQTAPVMALEALEAATTLSFDEGYKKEREISAKSLNSEQAGAIIHTLLSSRRAPLQRFLMSQRTPCPTQSAKPPSSARAPWAVASLWLWQTPESPS